MLRSTFAAYNAAHPDKPLINPRGAAAGTVRAKDPKTVDGRRLHFFAFDLDASEARRPISRRGCGRSASTPRGWSTATTRRRRRRSSRRSRPSRDELDYDLDGAVMRLADRNAYAGGGHALEFAARRARVQVRGRGEDDGARRRRSGTSARRARSRRSPRWSRCSSAGRR